MIPTGKCLYNYKHLKEETKKNKGTNTQRSSNHEEKQNSRHFSHFHVTEAHVRKRATVSYYLLRTSPPATK